MISRRRVHEILETAAPGDRVSHAFDIFLVTLIALNVIALLLETVRSIYLAAPRFFWWFEVISVAVFSVEYALRVWSAPADPRYAATLRGRLRWALTPLAVIDLLAVLPFYLPMLGLDLRVARAVRLFRLFRIAKLGRYSRALRMLGRVLVDAREELVSTFCILLLLLLVASSLLYFAEHEAQPEAFSSIPAAMWSGITTLTTVGYGDLTPVTVPGKLIAAVIAVLGIGMFAIPTGILGAAFVSEMRGERSAVVCPHCGASFQTGTVVGAEHRL